MQAVYGYRVSTQEPRWRWLKTFRWVFALSVCGPCFAEPATLYSYDSHNHLIQVTTTSGRAVRYVYDPAGNQTSTQEVQPVDLLSGTTDIPGLSPGQSALMTFYSDGTGTVAIAFVDLETTPIDADITFTVYDASGTQIATTTGSSGVSFSLSDLAAGYYYIVATPPSGASATFHANTTGVSVPVSDTSGDVPLPTWAIAMLGLVLAFAIVNRTQHAKQVS